jgi:hypothetical protein
VRNALLTLLLFGLLAASANPAGYFEGLMGARLRLAVGGEDKWPDNQITLSDPLAEGLVAYYRLNEIGGYAGTAGYAYLTNAVNNGADGAAYDTRTPPTRDFPVTTTNTPFGSYGLLLRADYTYGWDGSSSRLHGKSGATMACWLMQTTNSVSDSGILFSRGASGTLGIVYQTSGYQIRTRWQGNGSDSTASFSTNHQHRVWQHLAMVMDNGTSHLFINGVKVASTATSANTALYQAAVIYLGADTVQANRRLRAVFDEFCIWDRSLSDSEIASLYSKYSP